MHEDAAEFFDLRGRPGRAEHERGVAKRERRARWPTAPALPKKKETAEVSNQLSNDRSGRGDTPADTGGQQAQASCGLAPR